MTALDMFHFEYGKEELCPMTKLPRSCPKEYGYLADAEWCSEGVNNEDCVRCWARTLLDPFIAVRVPNYTPVDERKGYCDLGAFRLVVEDGTAVGVYCPGGLEMDSATTPGGFLVKIPVVHEMSAYPVDFADWQAARFSREAIEPSYLERLEGTVLEGRRNSEELNRRLDGIQKVDLEGFIRENAAELAGKTPPFFLRLANALRPIADAAEAGKAE